MIAAMSNAANNFFNTAQLKPELHKLPQNSVFHAICCGYRKDRGYEFIQEYHSNRKVRHAVRHCKESR